MMPSSPMLGRRSGTNSPKMDRLDFVKDSVIGELSSRIGKPIPEFNKNKRGKEKLILKVKFCLDVNQKLGIRYYVGIKKTESFF